nr:MAG TPA: hypothetical protein [Bacteriophage sp.]
MTPANRKGKARRLHRAPGFPLSLQRPLDVTFCDAEP